jgi:hypothetical protein
MGIGALLMISCICQAEERNRILEVGIAVTDITPKDPVWLAGYAARDQPSTGIDTPLKIQAVAFRDGGNESPVVLASLDNCEVDRQFMIPVNKAVEARWNLRKGRLIVVSSHTHGGPVLKSALLGMYQISEDKREGIHQYTQFLQERIVETVGAALTDLRPAKLYYGKGRAFFAMNRRVYKESGMAFGENPDGPVDWDVPVLKITSTTGDIRAVLFGYACHATSMSSGNADFYKLSGGYMAYARSFIEETMQTEALFLTGMGADSNPSPRGSLKHSKRHGLQLAGAVVGVLNRPMKKITGPMSFAFREVPLDLESPPSKTELAEDVQNENPHIKNRARKYLDQLKQTHRIQTEVPLPISILGFGEDLSIVLMAGEVVVDYSLQIKRMFKGQTPWTVGYAYEIPCYIPSNRLLKEGGYEAESSLVYYGIYGPFAGRIQDSIMKTVADLFEEVRN